MEKAKKTSKKSFVSFSLLKEIYTKTEDSFEKIMLFKKYLFSIFELHEITFIDSGELPMKDRKSGNWNFFIYIDSIGYPFKKLWFTLNNQCNKLSYRILSYELDIAEGIPLDNSGDISLEEWNKRFPRLASFLNKERYYKELVKSLNYGLSWIQILSSYTDDVKYSDAFGGYVYPCNLHIINSPSDSHKNIEVYVKDENGEIYVNFLKDDGNSQLVVSYDDLDVLKKTFRLKVKEVCRRIS